MFDSSRFNALVKEKGLTKAYIADKLGRKQSIFADWAKCKSKPLDAHIQIVAECLGCAPGYLLGETDDPTPLGKKNAPPAKTDEAILAYARERLGREPTPEDIATIHSAFDIAIQHIGNQRK